MLFALSVCTGARDDNVPGLCCNRESLGGLSEGIRERIGGGPGVASVRARAPVHPARSARGTTSDRELKAMLGDRWQP